MIPEIALNKMITGTPAERHFLASESFWLFCVYYFSDYLKHSLAPYHYDFFDDLEDLCDMIIRECWWIGFRECGKTSLAKIGIIWLIAHEKRRYINVDSFDRENAERILFDVAYEMTNNKRLQSDYGVLFSRRKGVDEIKQNRLANFVCENGVRIEAHSTQESVRWRLHLNQRPDCLLLDDIETSKTRDSEAYTKQVSEHISEAMAGMSPEWFILYLGNYITEYWNINKLMERAKTDNKIRMRNVPIIINNEPSWKAKYCMSDAEAKITGKVSIEDKERQLWSQVFSYEMMNQPIDDSIAEFKKEWIKRADESILEHMETNTFIAIDSALSDKENDKLDSTGVTICKVSRDNKWYITTYKKKMNSAELIEHMFYLNETYKPRMMGIEETNFVKAIQPFFEEEKRKRNIFFSVQPLKHWGRHKEARIRGLIPRYQNGSIFHVWDCNDLEQEMRVFPRGQHDDCMDSLAYIVDIAFKPYIIDNGYTPISAIPTYKKNLLTWVISYT